MIARYAEVVNARVTAEVGADKNAALTTALNGLGIFLR